MMMNLNRNVNRLFLKKGISSLFKNYTKKFSFGLNKNYNANKYFCESRKGDNNNFENKQEKHIFPDTQEKEANSTTETQAEVHTHIDYTNIKGVKNGDSSHYIIQFTCKKCEHRTTRMFTKRSYHHGIVLIKCEGCEGVHLIADNLGWFEDTSVNIEDIIKRKGEEYKRLSVDGLFKLSTKDVVEELKEETPKL